MSHNTTVTIDGPAASGKTVVGKLVSKHLNYRFLDTGSMYRAITREALQKEIKLDDDIALSQLAIDTDIKLIPQDTSGCVLVNGKKLMHELRNPDVDKSVSQVSSVSGVRTALVKNQRMVCEDGEIVVVGRDIGTVVLPDARIKIYLTASLEIRAIRRHNDTTSQEGSFDTKTIVEKLRERDHIDSTRENSPLRPANDAVIIDTDNLSVEEVADIIVDFVGTS